MSSNRYFTEGQSPEEQEQLTRKFLRNKIDAEKREKWSRQLEEEYKVSRSGTALGKRVSLRWVMAAAAAVLLVMVAFSQWFIGSNATSVQHLAADFLQEERFSHSDTRKSGIGEHTLRQDAIDEYMSGDFTKAIKNWEQLQVKNEATREDQFYLGLSYLYDQQFQKAVATLQLPVEQPDKFEQERSWFIALAQIQLGDVASAQTRLERIQPGQWNYEKAQKLLQSLNPQ